MKVAVLVLVVALVLGGLIGVLMSRDPGYVLIAYNDMAVETSLWFAVGIMAALYLLLRLIGWLIRRLGHSGSSLRGWTQRRRVRGARNQTVRGMLLLAEGRWAEARKRLEAAAPRVQAPLINYLNAARAAHELGDSRGRDELLRQAHESTPGSELAVGLTQAELQQAEGQWEQCLATLLQLQRQVPRHPQVLRMLVACYRQVQDWQAIIEIGNDLKRNKVMGETELRALLIEAWLARLQDERADPAALWKSLPKDLRREPALVARVARSLEAADRAGDAEPILRRAVEQDFDPELLAIYGALAGDPGRQLVVAEGWLKERPNDPDLLLALGRISLMNRQWAKAREYFEASLRLRRSAAAQGELGRLCVAMGELERGGELLAQSNDRLPALPQPEREEAPLPQAGQASS